MRQLKITKQITNRETSSLDRYLQEIGHEEMVSVQEEVLLVRRIKNGDEKALDRLVRANLRFVVSVAKQYQGQGLSLSDLINEGNIGLMKAAKKFDDTRGFKFISYAVWWIRQSIQHALDEHSRLVRLPLNKNSLLIKMNRVASILEQDLERDPTEQEIADALNMSSESIKIASRIHTRHLSLDQSLNNDRTQDSFNRHDLMYNNEFPEPDASLIKESLTLEIDQLFTVLNERERDILKMFFGMGFVESYSLEQIAEKIGLSRERTRQIKEKAIRRLRHGSRSRLLQKYLA